MKRYVLIFIAIIIFAGASAGYGYYKGKCDTMKSFQLRECWISEPSMDVNCTMYIGDL